MKQNSDVRVSVLHPGAMGISIAASALHSGHRVSWASEGRSEATRQRAAQHALNDLKTVAAVCADSDIILSVCPPHAAEDMAHQVIAAGFHGIYCDANAISPPRARHIGELVSQAGIDFVDGGIIGGPVRARGETWLYLAGKHAQQVADCFAAGPLETQIIGAEIGKASALKMCYAGFTKGTTALLCAILGAAEKLDVRAELYQQWTRDNPTYVSANEKRVRAVTLKAWRFEGEMQEIAATLGSAGIPEGFHRAAAEIYARLASLKDSRELPEIETILALLANESDSTNSD